MSDEDAYAVLGGETEAITEKVKESFDASASLASALSTAVAALSGERSLSAEELEVGILSRSGEGRCFERLENADIEQHLSGGA